MSGPSREQVIELAETCGVGRLNRLTVSFALYADRLERLAALAYAAGQAAEREACAKVCEARYMGDNNREDIEARKCAEAIRARSQQ